MRDVSTTGNLIRNSRIGIAVQAGAVQAGAVQAGTVQADGVSGLVGTVTGAIKSAIAGARAGSPSSGVGNGNVLIANNMISGAREGAIRTLRLHEAFGPDLARNPANPFAHIACAGNVAT